MPVKPKQIRDDIDDITVEDVIGTPQPSSEAKMGETKKVYNVPDKPSFESRTAPREIRLGSEQRIPVLPDRTKRNISPPSFIPGLVTSLNSSQISTLNGTDRYVSTPTQKVSGYLDIMSEGHGFLRPKFVPGEKDIYISQSQIRKFQLREGDKIEGQARLPKENERYLGLLKVEKVNDSAAEDSLKRAKFEDLTPIYPNEQIRLETDKTPLSTRIIDLLAPIGFGQRGLIVSPPKPGKTTILKELAHGISANYPKVHLMAVLIGERPE